MENFAINLLKAFAKPLLGKGIIDKRLPFLIPWFQAVYGFLQGDKTKVVTIPQGKLKVYSGDIGTGLPLTLKGSYEKTQTAYILDLVRKGSTFIDVGANAGYYSIIASKLTGTGGQVIAIEPDSKNIKLLEDNVKLNSCKNVTVIKKALGSGKGVLYFNAQRFNRGESSLAKDGKTKVEVISLDELVNELKIRKIDYINMDIEGAEILALKGAEKTLKKARNITLFIEYNPTSIRKFEENEEALVNQITSLGFRIESIIDEKNERIIPYGTKALVSVMENQTYCNLICKK